MNSLANLAFSVGETLEVRALTLNESGAIRAGVFVRFHLSKSEQGLLVCLAGSTDLDERRPVMFRLKSLAGRRHE